MDYDDGYGNMDARFEDIAYEEEISKRIAMREDQIEERINEKYNRGR